MLIFKFKISDYATAYHRQVSFFVINTTIKLIGAHFLLLCHRLTLCYWIREGEEEGRTSRQ